MPEEHAVGCSAMLPKKVSLTYQQLTVLNSRWLITGFSLLQFGALNVRFLLHGVKAARAADRTTRSAAPRY